MEVMSRFSATAYGVRELSSGQYFERNVCNISPFRASVVPGALQDPRLIDVISPGPVVGETVAMLEDGEFWVGEVTSVDADEFVCHYWATTGRNVSSAVFKPAYIGKTSGKTVLTYQLRRNEEPTDPWVGVCDRASYLGKVAFNIDKKGNHRLSASSRALVANLTMARL